MNKSTVKTKTQRKKRNAEAVKGSKASSPTSLRERDVELVRCCLQGDVAAWQELFAQCQTHLLLTVRSMLHPNGNNLNVADEIAARVWFSLVESNGRLLVRFDAHRGCRLKTFIAALARHELLEYWRSERRLRNRELQAVRCRPKAQPAEVNHFNMVWDEFLTTLSSREREFLEQVLLVPTRDSGSDALSQANIWQLRSRVRSKLKTYSNGNGSAS
jgi:DNA-directed RNA polymerase specialized sigma24 family protein